MNLTRREFVQMLGAGAAAGLTLGQPARAATPTAEQAEEDFYDLPKFGAVSFLHLTDCHAQLNPIYFREPAINLGVGDMRGRLPHLVGEYLLEAAGVRPDSAQAYALSCLDFEKAAERYGKVGGFAHLATLVKRLKASRPGALLLDGGDTWQGSGTALWTAGQDMVDACKLLGVDVMTGHWEFTLGAQRVQQIVNQDFKDSLAFVAQNVRTQDFGDPVFKPYVLRQINGVPCAIIGQAFPYTPLAHPRHLVADWTFGIQDENLQKMVDEVRRLGAQVVVVLSHNGMDVDLKMASRVTGVDAILGGHTHDAMPLASVVSNRSGKTIVTNAGSHGKFLGVLDLQVSGRRVTDFRYKLLPVFANLLSPDAEMAALIDRVRAPYAAKLAEPLAVTEGTLYRRGNFNGTADQLLLDALLEVQGAEIAFSPGFRWGPTLLPGQTITREWVLSMTATTYSNVSVRELSGQALKTILEDVCDNLFNPDPYYQQGGDMVRVGGLRYRCNPLASLGQRISDLRLHDQPIEADKNYKVASWAAVTEAAQDQGGLPMSEVVEAWLKARGGKVSARKLNVPTLTGGLPNPGYSTCLS